METDDVAHIVHGLIGCRYQAFDFLLPEIHGKGISDGKAGLLMDRIRDCNFICILGDHSVQILIIRGRRIDPLLIVQLIGFSVNNGVIHILNIRAYGTGHSGVRDLLCELLHIGVHLFSVLDQT